MITVKLQGGLGNQLFQYATARALAHWHGTSVAFDLSFFQNLGKGCVVTPRIFELGAFGITPDLPPPTARVALGLTKLPLTGTLQRLARRGYPVTEYRERSLRYDPDLFETTSINTHLVGYFQSELYFKKIEDLLRQKLNFINEPNSELAGSISTTRSASLHIRRGDYVNSPATRQFHGLCSIDYYEKASDYLAERFSNIHFFVFSDDLTWARENLLLPYPVTFVECHAEADSHKDMQLMSQCRHHIIANSSFSWWGAWLNPAPDKIVIAPEQWFADETAQEQTHDLIPASWIRM